MGLPRSACLLVAAYQATIETGSLKAVLDVVPRSLYPKRHVFDLKAALHSGAGSLRCKSAVGADCGRNSRKVSLARGSSGSCTHTHTHTEQTRPDPHKRCHMGVDAERAAHVQKATNVFEGLRQLHAEALSMRKAAMRLQAPCRKIQVSAQAFVHLMRATWLDLPGPEGSAHDGARSDLCHSVPSRRLEKAVHCAEEFGHPANLIALNASILLRCHHVPCDPSALICPNLKMHTNLPGHYASSDFQAGQHPPTPGNKLLTSKAAPLKRCKWAWTCEKTTTSVV